VAQGFRITSTASELPFVNTASGLTATDVQAALDEAAAQIAALGQPPATANAGTYLVAGGRVIYNGTGYAYTVTAGSGYIAGKPVSWAEQTVTLDAADETNDRIDVFVVNASGTASAVKGTAAATPSKPDVDPALYLELSFALVYADTSTPTGTTVTTLYAENAGTPTEWAATTSNAGTVAVGSTTGPRAGTYCIRAANATAGTTITLTGAAPITPADYDALVIYLKINSAWNTKGSLSAQWYLGTVKVGNPVTLIPGQNGLVNTNTTTYQGQVFLIPQFAFPAGATVDRLVFTVTGATLNFALDDMAIQDFGGGVTVNSTTGITQAEADARYAALAHTHDAAALTYTPETAADWDSGADPGDVDDALNQLAGRAKDLESATAGSGVQLANLETYQRFIIAAHRGDINATDGYPENTLEACRAAARKGVQRIEVDPRLSADGTLYLMHDATVDRTTDGTGNVADKTDAQMNALTIDDGYGYRVAHAGLYHPPTLLSVMNAVAPYGVTIQLDGTADAVTLAQFAINQGWAERVVITCTTQADAQAVKALDSRIAVMGPPSETSWAEIDIVQYAWQYLPNEATILGLVPKSVSIYQDIVDYGTADVAAQLTTVYNRGARYFTTHDINTALATWHGLELGDANPADMTSGSATDNYVLTADGSGGAAWETLPALANHDHSGDAGDGGTFDAANLTSSTATDGYVLTADGSGGAAWEAVAGGEGIGDVLWTELQAAQLVNEIKNWPPYVGMDIDLVAKNLWWDSVGTPSTAATMVDIAGESGITETWEHCLKCVTDGNDEGFYQRFTYADEPRIKSGRTISAIAAIWVGTAGKTVTMALANQTTGSVTATATAQAWTIVKAEGHTCGDSYVDLKFTCSAADTFYVVPLGMCIGARAVPLGPRPARECEPTADTNLISNVDSGATWTDVDLTASTSNLAWKAEISCIYACSAQYKSLNLRRNGDTKTDWSTKVLVAGVANEQYSGRAMVTLDDGQIFEYAGSNAAGDTEAIWLSLVRWWEWA
jgi:glycerophosphoryl diester phosphodiesterase